MLEARPHQPVNGRHHLGIVQAILGLPLELRFLDEDRQDAGEPLANVLSAERHALRRQVVGLDVVADRLAEPGAEAALVRATRGGGNAIDVAAEALVGGLGPLQHDLELGRAVLLEREGRFVHRLRVALGDDLLQVIDQPLVVLEDILLSGGLVFEGDLHAAVQVAGHFQSLANQRRFKLDLGKDLRIGLEEHGRAGTARWTHRLQAALRLALLEGHLVLEAIAADRRHQLA